MINIFSPASKPERKAGLPAVAGRRLQQAVESQRGARPALPVAVHPRSRRRSPPNPLRKQSARDEAQRSIGWTSVISLE
jgi:hypothetical protein